MCDHEQVFLFSYLAWRDRLHPRFALRMIAVLETTVPFVIQKTGMESAFLYQHP
jgi:hypothetical protein